MPFTKYMVEPVYLSRKAIPPDKGLSNELEAVTNNTLVAVVRQLASLVNIADNVFFEVADQCKELASRTERLRARVETLDEEVSKLNAKKTAVPQGDMHSFSLFQNHFQNSPAASWSYFTTAKRPSYVQSKCERLRENQNNSSPLLRIVEQYGGRRKHPTDNLLFCWPVIGDSKWKEHLEIETRKPVQAVLCDPETDASSSCSSPVIVCQWPLREEELERLPSPEERMLAIALEHPSALVPVNTNTFHRMATLRRSLMHPDFLIKRKSRKKHGKRRNTICVDTCSSQKDVLELQPQVTKSSQAEPSTSRVSPVQKGNSGLVSFLRDKAKRHSVVPTDRNSLYETVKIIPPATAPPLKEKRFSLLSLRSSEPKEKRDLLKESKKQKEEKKQSSSVVMSGTNNGKGGKSRSFLPISTLSAAMSVAVKLRGTIGRPSKSAVDDPQSSSGNWSATSSNRGSVDSDQHAPTTSTPEPGSITSQSSLEKDSMLSDTTQQEGRSHDGILAGYTSDASTSLVNSWRPMKFGDRSNTLTPENHYSDATGSSTPRVTSPYIGSRPFMDSLLDDEESVYSVDTDGYFTSMHTDSGLKNMSMSRTRCRRESESSVSTLGNISLNSILSRSAFESSPPPPVRERRAPVPPVRASIPKCPPLPKPSSHPSPPESDPETKERLRLKTKIDPSRYPSMVSVSPDTSDEDPKAILKEISQTFPLTSSPVFDSRAANLASPEKNKSPGPFLSSFAASVSSTKNSKNVQENVSEISSQSSKNTTRNERLFPSFSRSNSSGPSIPKMPTKYEGKSANDRESMKSPSPSTSSLQSVPPQMPLIPLKYAQHITVTPVLRDPKLESGMVYSKSQIFRPKYSNNQPERRPNSALGYSSPGQRAVAKVTLDAEGKVIFSSNSLGRRRDGHPMNYLTSEEQLNVRKYSTLPSRLRENVPPPSSNIFQPSVSNQFAGGKSTNAPSSTPTTSKIPSRQIVQSPLLNKPENSLTCRPTNIPHVPLKRKADNINTVSSAMSLDSLLQTEKVGSSPSHISSSGSSELYSTPRALQSSKSGSSDSLGKKMSTEDLFLAIHQCKKKLNLKPLTPSSSDTPASRCTSPLSPPSRPQSRSELAESGRLTPRKDMQNEGSEPRRKNLASDRLGTNRQTSMRDFKLLLLQARSTPTPRKTASELLRVSTPTPTPMANTYSGPSSLPSSPCKELVSPSRNSHEDWSSPSSSTIPFKRNSRCRSSLQNRYDYPMYPPILEEGKEESEQLINDPPKNAKPGSNYSFTPISKAPATYAMYSQRSLHKPATSTWV